MAIVHVSAGIIVRDGTVLVGQRAAGSTHAGQWEFPGGKREEGESLESALQRELHEELGIEAVIGPVLWRVDHQYAGRTPVALTFFAVAGYAGTVENRCFADLRWVRIADLPQLDFLEADRGLIDAIQSGRVRVQGWL